MFASRPPQPSPAAPANPLLATAPLLAISLVLSLAGCANPGPPRPPSLNLPAIPRDLVVQRIGDRVEARWSTPRLTTDKTSIAGPIVAMLCAERPAAGAQPPSVRRPGARAPQRAGRNRPATPAAAQLPCDPAGRTTVSPGASMLLVPLPADLAAGPPDLLAYRVELFNARGRSAGRSAAAWTASGAAPPPVGPIAVTAGPDGALITWQRNPASIPGEQVELVRSSMDTSAPAIASKKAPPAVATHVRNGHAVREGQVVRSPLAQAVASPHSGEVRLAAAQDSTRASKQVESQGANRPDGSAPAAGQPGPHPKPDPGGLLDRSVEPGVRYTYVAQRVRVLTLAGHSVRLLGQPSPAVSLLYRDVFPPTPPAGLEAVPVGGFAGQQPVQQPVQQPGEQPGPASPLSLDLSWEPSPEPDVAGYNIYRSTGQGPFKRLNQTTPVAVPGYRDTAVEPGKLYRYRVTAVDTSHNESQPGPEIEEQMQPQ